MMSRRETNSTTKMKIKNSKKKNKNKNNKLIQYRVRGGLRCIDGARWTNNFAINHCMPANTACNIMFLISLQLNEVMKQFDNFFRGSTRDP